MTNPPVNWGYPRTAVGWIHTITRGQFEATHPVDDFRRLAGQIIIYGEIAAREFGIVYLVPAALPFILIYRMHKQERGWLLGLAATFACLSVFLGALLNANADRQSTEIVKFYFAPSHIVLAIWMAYGLAIVGTLAARDQTE